MAILHPNFIPEKTRTLLATDDQGATGGDDLALAADHLPHKPPVVIQQRLARVAAPGDGNVVPPACCMPSMNMLLCES